MDKNEVLRNLDFGAIIAEQDNLLTKCFISHPVLNEILQDRKDIVLGTKGSGKSALWKELKENQDKYEEIKDVKLELVTNPSGDPEFRAILGAISEDKFPSADELRSVWRLYLLTQFWQSLRPHLKNNIWLAQYDEALKRFGIIPDISGGIRKSFAFALAKIQKVQKFDLRWAEGVSLEFSDGDLNSGGNISGIPFNRLLNELNNAAVAENIRIWLILDRLDEIILGDEEKENIVLKGLLFSYRDMSDFSNLRIKIFLRDDVYERVTRFCLTLTEQAQIALDNGHVDDAEIVEGQLLVAGSHGAALLEPADAAFDHIAASIVRLVVADGPPPPRLPGSQGGRNHGPDAMAAQPVPNPLGVIGPIGRQAFGPSLPMPGRKGLTASGYEGLELPGVVRLARRERRRQRQTATIAQQMEFGAKASARTP